MSLLSFSLWTAQLGGIGRSPFAPGTVATAVVGIPAAYLLAMAPPAVAIVALATLFLLACYVSDQAETKLGKCDPSQIVIDELVGYLITMIGLSVSLKSIVLGFVAFRVFDIWKPWPVNLLNREIPGGFWIVADDVGAACYAHALVWLILCYWT
jgi:phosphatidylglycerophosphatase A